jgi:5'-nucleotidase
MGESLDNKLVVAISSRALFDLEEENRLFEATDDTAYMALQARKIEEPAQPGVAFSLVKKLLAFNDVQSLDPLAKKVEVVVLSRNDPVSGIRIMKSAEHYNLPITRCAFTRGQPPWHYLKPIKANLFLSAKSEDVRAALDNGFPAATVATHSAKGGENYPNEVRIAFDGDAVLFSDEAERVYKEGGIDAFRVHEVAKAMQPLPPGPFRCTSPLTDAWYKPYANQNRFGYCSKCASP